MAVLFDAEVRLSLGDEGLETPGLLLNLAPMFSTIALASSHSVRYWREITFKLSEC